MHRAPMHTCDAGQRALHGSAHGPAWFGAHFSLVLCFCPCGLEGEGGQGEGIAERVHVFSCFLCLPCAEMRRMYQLPTIAHFCNLFGEHLSNGSREAPSSLPDVTAERLETSLLNDADAPDSFLVDLHIRLLRGILATRKIT